MARPIKAVICEPMLVVRILSAVGYQSRASETIKFSGRISGTDWQDQKSICNWWCGLDLHGWPRAGFGNSHGRFTTFDHWIFGAMGSRAVLRADRRPFEEPATTHDSRLGMASDAFFSDSMLATATTEWGQGQTASRFYPTIFRPENSYAIFREGLRGS
jgi:hypothetical protein